MKTLTFYNRRKTKDTIRPCASKVTSIVSMSHLDGYEYSNQIGEHDVICGRSRAAFNNGGNRRFRVIVSLYLEQYVNVNTTNKEKNRIINEIIESVRQCGGRFIQLQNGDMHELSDKQTYEKVRHAIRDMANSRKVGDDSWMGLSDATQLFVDQDETVEMDETLNTKKAAIVENQAFISDTGNLEYARSAGDGAQMRIAEPSKLVDANYETDQFQETLKTKVENSVAGYTYQQSISNPPFLDTRDYMETDSSFKPSIFECAQLFVAQSNNAQIDETLNVKIPVSHVSGSQEYDRTLFDSTWIGLIEASALVTEQNETVEQNETLNTNVEVVGTDASRNPNQTLYVTSESNDSIPHIPVQSRNLERREVSESTVMSTGTKSS